MKTETVTLDAISTKNAGLKINGKFYDVEGNAREILPKLAKGQAVKIGFEDIGNQKVIVSIDEEVKPKIQASSSIEDRIARSTALKAAVEIAKITEKQGNQVSFKAICETADEFVKYIKTGEY